ncbi:MAG TPA: nitroreductase family protein [Oscillospiraceae bacterium]|nr:nitroreductase family protein [Oscillospiraceae bacterium]
MNEVLKQLKNRKSVRVFEDKPIAVELKEEILGAAFEAPTAGAMMLYSIIDVTDDILKQELAIVCDDQPFIAKAPLVLVFVADYQRWYDAYGVAGCEVRQPGEGDILLACADALIAAQNTVVAAEALGLGSCYIGDIMENCEKVRELLALPDYVLPAAMVVYGYPTAKQLKREKPARFNQQYLVFENQYRKLSAKEHLAMQEERLKKRGLNDVDGKEEIRAVCLRKYLSDFTTEMNRSVGEYLKKFR